MEGVGKCVGVWGEVRESVTLFIVKQGNSEYQFLSHCFDPTRNRISSLPFQKQTLHPIGHLIVIKTS